jgi:hypothetical protein
MSAVIHTRAVMVSGTLRPALQPVSVHVLALCAFCNNPVHAPGDTTDSRQSSIIQAENMSAVIHTQRCDVSGTDLPCSLFLQCTGTLVRSPITLCVHKVTTDSRQL